MNKKIIIGVIFLTVFIIIGGIFYRQHNNQTNLKSNSCSSPDCNESPQSVQNLVEVFYLPHPPVDPIRQKIKEILQKFPDYKLKEYSFDDDTNQKKINQYNLVGHIPVAIFINGINAFTINGAKVVLKNFPKSNPFAPTLVGSWDYSDLGKILANPNKYKND